MGWGAYYGLATRRSGLTRWQRGGKRELIELPVLFVDIDQPEYGQERIEHFTLLPSCVVSSGRGLHLYWHLTEPTRAWDTAGRILHGLAAQFNGDPAMSVAQSMRLPGTMNTKPGRESALCQILEHHPERRYSLAEFAPILGKSVLEESTRVTQRCAKPNCASSLVGRRSTSFAELNSVLVETVVQRLVCDYGGYMKANGWVAAYCPCGHMHDRPGAHFGFNPEYGVGVCFGRHGRLRLIDLCPLLGIDWRSYGWLIREKSDQQVA